MKNLQKKTLLFFILIISTKILFSIQTFGKTPTEFIESAVAKKAQTTQVIQNSISDLHKSIGEMQRDLTKARQHISTGLGQPASVAPVTPVRVAPPILPATVAGQRREGVAPTQQEKRGLQQAIFAINGYTKSLTRKMSGTDFEEALGAVESKIEENQLFHRDTNFKKAVHLFSTEAGIQTTKPLAKDKAAKSAALDTFLENLQKYPELRPTTDWFVKEQTAMHTLTEWFNRPWTQGTTLNKTVYKDAITQVVDFLNRLLPVGSSFISKMWMIEKLRPVKLDKASFKNDLFEFIKSAHKHKELDEAAFKQLLEIAKQKELGKGMPEAENNQLDSWYAEAGMPE
jgi:hypothetical protein